MNRSTVNDLPMDDATDSAPSEEVHDGNGQASAVEAPADEFRTPADPTPIPDPGDDEELNAPGLFLNRELTWLNYDLRVLHEAEDARTPLLERVKFVAITGSNLDEFFMKRIGGLKQQVGAGIHKTTVDGRTPSQQIVESYALVRDLNERKRLALRRVLDELAEHDILLTTYDRVAEDDRRFLREQYLNNIFPLVTPQAIDPAHPFPFISNLSLNLLVGLRYRDEHATSIARVKVPVGTGIPRLLKLESRNVFVTLESVMAGNLDLLFPGMEIETCDLFRVTRNANTELEEEQADDLLEMIETELRERRFAPIVRLEVATGMSAYHRGMLAAELGLDEESDVFEVEGTSRRCGTCRIIPSITRYWIPIEVYFT